MTTSKMDVDAVPEALIRCIDCGLRARLIATKRTAEQPARQIWQCVCGAFSDCQKGTVIPLSRPAGKDSKNLRRKIGRQRNRWIHAYVAKNNCSKAPALEKLHELTHCPGDAYPILKMSKSALERADAALQALLTREDEDTLSAPQRPLTAT